MPKLERETDSSYNRLSKSDSRSARGHRCFNTTAPPARGPRMAILCSKVDADQVKLSIWSLWRLAKVLFNGRCVMTVIRQQVDRCRDR